MAIMTTEELLAQSKQNQALIKEERRLEKEYRKAARRNEKAALRLKKLNAKKLLRENGYDRPVVLLSMKEPERSPAYMHVFEDAPVYADMNACSHGEIYLNNLKPIRRRYRWRERRRRRKWTSPPRYRRWRTGTDSRTSPLGSHRIRSSRSHGRFAETASTSWSPTTCHPPQRKWWSD